jgi:predicted transcriptional regulator
MRTTIDLRDDHRARLLEIAAGRGHRGISAVVAEAIEAYIETLPKKEERRKIALDLRGSLTEEEGEELRRATRSDDQGV